MAKVYDLLVRARGETRDAERAMKQLQRTVDQFGKRTRRVGLGLTAAVTLPLVGLGRMGAGELGEIEKANAQTERAMKRVGKESLISAANIRVAAGALQEKSGIDDQAIQSAQNLLVTLSGLDLTTKTGADSFKKARFSLVEFADTMGIDVSAAAKLYSKSIAAAGQGTILLPKGVKLSAAEMEKLEKRMDAASSSGEKQALVIDALSRKFRGGMDLTNSEKWNVAMDKLAGSAAKLIVLLLPAFDKLVGVVGSVTAWFERLSPQAQKLVGIGLLIAGALGPVLIIVGSLVSAFAAIIPVLAAISLPALAVIAAVVALGAAFVAAYTKSDKFRAQVNNAFKQVLATVRSVVGDLRSLINDFVVTGKIAWERWGSDIMGVMRPYLRAVATFVGTWIANIRDVIKIALALVRGDWGDAWGLLKGVVSRSLSAAASIAKSMGKAIVSAVKSIGSGLKALGGFFLEKGMDLGRAIVNGIKDAISGAAGDIKDAAVDIASDALDAATGGLSSKLGRSGRSASRPKAGVSVLGNLFGEGVTYNQVMQYIGLEGASAYSVTQNGNGTQTLETNKDVVDFLERRKKANEAVLAKRLSARKAFLKVVAAKRAAWIKEKQTPVPKNVKKKAARATRISNKFANWQDAVGRLDDLNAEILALGGAIEDDTEALTPPEVDSVADAVEATDAGAGDAGSTTASSGAAGGTSGGSTTQALVQGSNYQPLLPSSVSASAAVASAAQRALTAGQTVNIFPSSVNEEALARRVAFILGSNTVAMGGGF